MRSDWVPVSASALVVGALSLVFGAMLNPSDGGQSVTETLRVVDEHGTRWLGTAVMFLLASIALTVGLPALLSLFDERGYTLGAIGVGLFVVGVIGTAGYAVILIFFRALVVADAVRADGVEKVSQDGGMQVFFIGWIGGFYVGLLIVAVALFRARKTPIWVPILLVLFVASFPFANMLGRVGSAIQVMLLAVAFTGIAVAAVTSSTRAEMVSRSAA